MYGFVTCYEVLLSQTLSLELHSLGGYILLMELGCQIKESKKLAKSAADIEIVYFPAEYITK